MNIIKEYPIKCHTCNEQIACYSYDYETFLESGYSVEDALNTLGIKRECSRIAMMFPVMRTFDISNRQVVEGLKTVDLIIDDDEPNESSKRQGIYSSCLNTTLQQSTFVNPLQQSTFVNPLQQSTFVNPLQNTFINPLQQNVNSLSTQLENINLSPTLPTINTKFDPPTVPGIPAINYNGTVQPEKIFVGAGKYVEILNSRSYLAC